MSKTLVRENNAKIANGHSIVISIEAKNKESSEAKLSLLWFDISGFSKSSQFISCCVGLFVFYLLYGFLLELIFTLDGLKPYGWYITLMQFGYYSIFGWAERVISGVKDRKYVRGKLNQI